MGRNQAMNAKRIVKVFLAWVYYHSGIVCLKLKNMSRSAYPILMYHRVVSEKEAAAGVEPGMYVTPGTFEKHLLYLKQHFSVVSLEDVQALSAGHRLYEDRAPFCVITFDDGWRDFYENVYPLLKHHGIPVTVFLPTGFIGQNEPFWTDRLIRLYYERDPKIKKKTPSSNSLVNTIEGFKGSRDATIEKTIALLKTIRFIEIEKVISTLSDRWEMDYTDDKRVFLNWREVNEMLRSGLVSFGSHTHRHQILTTLDREEIATELVLSRDQLLSKNIADPQFISFCYPNGNFNDIVADKVKEFGYKMAVTTENGWNRWKTDPYRLKRVPVHQDMTSSEMLFSCRLAGLL